MPSEADICNAALSYAKSALTIGDLQTDQSIQARYCRAHFEISREEVLRSVDWNFARDYIALSLHAAPILSHHLYRYDYPNNIVAVRRIVPENKRDKNPPFQLSMAGGTETRTILTDKEGAIAEVTLNVKNVSIFDVLCADGLSLKLATKIAIPLGGSRALRQELEGYYQHKMQLAAAHDANEYGADEEGLPDHLQARG